MNNIMGLLLLWAGLVLAFPGHPATAQEVAASETAGSQVAQPAATRRVVRGLPVPTVADRYCAGFLSQAPIPQDRYVSGGVGNPSATRFVLGDTVFLTGPGFASGRTYSVVRELRDPNRYEIFPGQHRAAAAVGRAYADVAQVRVASLTARGAIAEVTLSCDALNPGDSVVAFEPRAEVRPPEALAFERFSSVTSTGARGRIVLARDFDSVLGTRSKVYLDLGSQQGVKPGDLFRVLRSYSSGLADPVDGLSFKAPAQEDTQKHPAAIEPTWLERKSRRRGPEIHVSDLPARGVGELLIIGATPTSATAMVLYALEEIHLGDEVVFDPPSQP